MLSDLGVDLVQDLKQLGRVGVSGQFLLELHDVRDSAAGDSTSISRMPVSKSPLHCSGLMMT